MAKLFFDELTNVNKLNKEIFATPKTIYKGQKSCLHAMECNGDGNQDVL